jgi:hypothetical protein
MHKRIILVLFLLFNGYIVIAQKKNSFATDTVNYPNEVAMLMGSSLSAEDEIIINTFKENWKTDFFPMDEKVAIMACSRSMFAKKASGIPHFRSLILFLLEVKKKENTQPYVIPFLTYFSNFVSAKKTTLAAANSLLLTLTNLFSGRYIYKTTTVQWQYTGDDFRLITDSTNLAISIKNCLLTCYSKRDSIQIINTSGTFYPLENRWTGKTGTVTWQRAGLDPNEVYVRLNNYRIELNRSEYTADSVMFNYSKYFKQPVMGVLKDKVMQLVNPESATYPEFDTYIKRYLLQDLYENVDYDGGFSMKGAKIIGSGSENEDAKIIIKKNNKELMEVRSKYFVFRPQRVNGINTVVRINIESDTIDYNRKNIIRYDSIYHSDLSFIYYVDKKEISLFKTDEYSSQSPYYNSYHKVDMNFEQLTWRIDQPKIRMTMARGSSIGRARFESQSFYNQLQFESLQGNEDSHPLFALQKFSRIIKREKFPAESFADYIGRPLNDVRQQAMYLAQKGFIYYNSSTDLIAIKPRLYDYIKASGGKVDFDVIDFESMVQAPMDNAVLDMDTYDLSINGIPRIAVSDSQNVVIYPAHDQIIVKQNKSFQFDGKIEAGLFTYYGTNFFFNYDAFKINLQNVDSVTLKVYTGERDGFGKPITQEIKSVIQHITGDLRIDRPDNKSGRYNYPDYPLFASRENSFVYYQAPEIQNGVYPEESFYFELYPFVIDSLDNFKKEGLTFKGKFYSSGILPPIEQNLTLQPDYSLGFKFNPGANGIPVYENKGMMYGDLNLSHNGLRGKGKLTYLTSTTLAEDFKFYPDSMNTQSSEFTIAEQTTATQFPRVNSVENYIHWNTQDNEMYIKQGKGPFSMFNKETTLAGSLMLAPRGLTGEGLMNLTTAELSSNQYRYKAQIINADTSKFNLKSLHKEGFTVLTNNVNSHVDFTNRNGEFTANDDYTLVSFPENKYISYLDFFKWNMDPKTLEMGARKTAKHDTTKETQYTLINRRFRFSEEPIGPRYISVHNKQDSLNFVAPLALYDYENNMINASDVKLIRVADAIIYTSDGKVTIAEAAQMRSLYKTTIVADYKNRYHTFHTADINITSRNSFTGTGKYDYLDEQEKVQVINLNEIKVDTARNTVALASITEPDSFTISPHFAFQGRFTLHSTRPLPTFDGGAQIIADCRRLKPSWLKFTSELDPKNVIIPVDENPVNINNTKIYNGMFIANDSIHIYPAFLSGRRNYNDKFIATSSGILRYNKDSSAFEIAPLYRLNNNDTTGNYLSLHKFNCTEFAQGEINLGAELGQVKLKSYGKTTMNAETRETKLEILMAMDFTFDPVILKSVANKIDSFPDLKGFDITSPLYVKYLNNLMGKTKASKYLEEVTLLGDPKEFPAELQHTIFFTSLNLRWNPQSKSYQSYGKIGIGNIGSTQINKLVDGFIEITKRRSGDFMDVYLKLDYKNYYYFGYTRGVMQAYSSNKDFVLQLRDLSIKQRQMNVPRGETSYIYMVSSDSRMASFFRSYKRYQKEQGKDEILEIPTFDEITPDTKQKKNKNDEDSNIENKDQETEPVEAPDNKTDVKKDDDKENKQPSDQPEENRKDEKEEEKIIEVQ